eukprot:TRINITY_DN2227_c0_g2_i1.p1 TRINITY_DN2227_c0_g2~~TRINITY_DN2227_c0_g2_i1.p1  ORF type:complete len:166 (-),score=20.24 TRINITY_DN2227_c0_g2_i1:414-911(-)
MSVLEESVRKETLPCLIPRKKKNASGFMQRYLLLIVFTYYLSGLNNIHEYPLYSEWLQQRRELEILIENVNYGKGFQRKEKVKRMNYSHTPRSILKNNMLFFRDYTIFQTCCVTSQNFRTSCLWNPTKTHIQKVIRDIQQPSIMVVSLETSPLIYLNEKSLVSHI